MKCHFLLCFSRFLTPPPNPILFQLSKQIQQYFNKYVHIYRKLHWISSKHSKHQYIAQNTPKTLKFMFIFIFQRFPQSLFLKIQVQKTNQRDIPIYWMNFILNSSTKCWFVRIPFWKQIFPSSCLFMFRALEIRFGDH